MMGTALTQKKRVITVNLINKQGGIMSVRAYKVKKIEYETRPTFNLWHDEKIMEYFQDEFEPYESFTDNGNGFMYVPVRCLKYLIENKKEFALDNEDIELIKRDIEGFEDCENDLIEYICF